MDVVEEYEEAITDDGAPAAGRWLIWGAVAALVILVAAGLVVNGWAL